MKYIIKKDLVNQSITRVSQKWTKRYISLIHKGAMETPQHGNVSKWKCLKNWFWGISVLFWEIPQNWKQLRDFRIFFKHLSVLLHGNETYGVLLRAQILAFYELSTGKFFCFQLKQCLWITLIRVLGSVPENDIFPFPLPGRPLLSILSMTF